MTHYLTQAVCAACGRKKGHEDGCAVPRAEKAEARVAELKVAISEANNFPALEEAHASIRRHVARVAELEGLLYAALPSMPAELRASARAALGELPDPNAKTETKR